MNKGTTNRETINYIGMPRLFLETADKRLFEHPYGPNYSQAVGKIFASRWVSGPDESDVSQAFVEEIIPNVFTKTIGGIEVQELVPIEVISQAEHQGKLILTARINYRPNSLLVLIRITGMASG